MKIAIAGQFYTTRSLTAAAQRCFNFYPETIENSDGSGKSLRILRNTPGFHLLANLNAHAGNVRGFFSGGGRCFVVVGQWLYEINNAGAVVAPTPYDLGSNDTLPVWMAGNGNQLGIVANGQFYISNGAAPVKARFQLNGVVTAITTAITWQSGDKFPTYTPTTADPLPTTIYISQQPYTVASWNSATSVTLTTSLGGGAGTATLLFDGELLWTTGDVFTASLVGLPITVSLVISAISKATSAVVTRANHGMPIGSTQSVTISGATGTGWTAVNATWNATVIDANTFSIPIDSTGFGTLGGTVVFNPVVYTVQAVQSTLVLTLVNPSPGNIFPGAGPVTFNAALSSLPYSVAGGDLVTAVTGAYMNSTYYVQRPAPVTVTYTDLVIDGADNTKITSAGHPFDTSWVGGRVQITSGAGFTVGTYTIISVTGTAAFLSGAVGTVGSTGGHGIGFPPDLGRQVNFSAVLDGTSWAGLDFITKEDAPDYLQAIFADRGQLYLTGTAASEVWQNDPNSGLPVHIAGASAAEGNSARYGIVSMAEHIYFLGGSPGGGAVAYRLDGFTPTRISTHAIEEAWAQFADQIQSAVSWWYLEEGHYFWVICISNDHAWVYDATEKAWHERSGGTVDAGTPYTPWFHTYIPEWTSGSLRGLHIVGAYNSAKVYVMSAAFSDDDGSNVNRVRDMPYIYAGGGKRVYVGRFSLDMDTGEIPSGAEPLIYLQWSLDNGTTITTPEAAGFGTHGQYGKRVFWIQNGSAETSMIPRITYTGQLAITLIDVEAEVYFGDS